MNLSKLKSKEKRYTVKLSESLYLRVYPSGHKSFVLRYNVIGLGLDSSNGIGVNYWHGCHSATDWVSLYNITGVSGGNSRNQTVVTDASLANSVYTNSGHVRPLSLSLNYIIKT